MNKTIFFSFLILFNSANAALIFCPSTNRYYDGDAILCPEHKSNQDQVKSLEATNVWCEENGLMVQKANCAKKNERTTADIAREVKVDTNAANSKALALIVASGPRNIAEKILKPALGESYDAFRDHYKFIHLINMYIETPGNGGKNKSYNEFKAYSQVVRNATGNMDSFVFKIAENLNTNPTTIVMAFGLTKEGSFVYDQVDIRDRNKNIALKYWLKYPEGTEKINDFYDSRPPPILFGKVYPAIIAELNKGYFLSEIIRLASIEGAALALNEAVEKKRREDAEAEEARREEVRRLAAIKEQAAKREAAILLAKQQADEKAAQEAANEAAAKDREAAAKLKKEAYERKRLESAKYVRARLEALKTAGINQTDVINLMVSWELYKGKKVFIKCIITSIDQFGGQCFDNGSGQYVLISSDGIDRGHFKWLLQNCQKKYSNDNHWYCKSVPIVGMVMGPSQPTLTNVLIYELCKDPRTERSTRLRNEEWAEGDLLEGCDLENKR
jgi:hypothetical protein